MIDTNSVGAPAPTEHVDNHGKGKKPNLSMAIMLAWVQLVDAQNVACASANVSAKALQNNANYLRKLNDDLDHEQYLVATPCVYSTGWTDTYHPGNKYHAGWSTHKHYKHLVKGNPKAASQDMMANRQIAGARQVIGDRMKMLQQESQVGMTQVNTIADDDTTSMQNSNYFMQVLQSVLNDVLIRQPPQQPA